MFNWIAFGQATATLCMIGLLCSIVAMLVAADTGHELRRPLCFAICFALVGAVAIGFAVPAA